MKDLHHAITEFDERNNANESTLQKSTRFLDLLPIEIAMKIASYLDQNDCLTCMAVCRSWYVTAPEYMQQAWEKVQVTFDVLCKHNKRWKQCIGDYTKSISLFNDITGNEPESLYSLHYMIQKLIDCNCGPLKSLDFAIPAQGNKAQFRLFLSLLQRLTGPSIHQLTIKNKKTKLSFVDILCKYPNVTHFTFMHLNDIRQRASLPQLNHLVQLFLDVNTDVKLQLEPVLRNSPNLQYLSYGGPEWNTMDDQLPAFHIKNVFSWCPALIYLETNAHCSKYRAKSLDLLKQNNASGLRSFIQHEAGGYWLERVIPYLMHNKNSLEFMAIQCHGDWIPMATQLNALRILVLDYTKFHGSESHDFNLASFPTLEELELIGENGTPHFDMTKLHQIHTVKRLILRHITLRCDNNISNCTILNEIELDHIRPMNDLLIESICHVSTLERLSISFNEQDEYSENGLVDIALRLCQLKQLELNSINTVSESMFRALENLKYLRLFAASKIPSKSYLIIDSGGLNTFVSTSKSLLWMNLEGTKLSGNESDDRIIQILQQNAPDCKVDISRKTNMSGMILSVIK